ncbi:uncharacterized protein LOC108481952 [Gossypium arboreum]|uniref:uncharacterized protein LOC108481952 n=1 Tax=Gossypium arboreum TaxID=29729 RepID=UPI00081953BB|nr:uncharacterized protein LOC108481952 [Gossypium arboreum]
MYPRPNPIISLNIFALTSPSLVEPALKCRSLEKPEPTAEKATMLICPLSKDPWHCRKTWLLSSFVCLYLGHPTSAITLFSLRLVKVGILFQEIFHTVILIFEGICKFHNFL